MSFNKHYNILFYAILYIQTSDKIFWMRNVSFFGYYRRQNMKKAMIVQPCWGWCERVSFVTIKVFLRT